MKFFPQSLIIIFSGSLHQFYRDLSLFCLEESGFPTLINQPFEKVQEQGRKGTEQNIIFKVIREMARVYGSRPEELLAGFGPAIGGCFYEVGEDCIRPFKDLFPDEKNLYRFDLSGRPVIKES